jgi:ubiquinone/menaquinone biosynthesis C-methylase UbiE
MQKFYERCTFPGYDGIDSPAILVDKARRSGFGAWLDSAISPFASVLEVGCGTGQLTNFLGIAGTRQVTGLDMSVASLALGQKFKTRFELNNVHFIQGNIFAMPIQDSSFDVLICSGVLHHTPDPREGFRRLLRLTKPGGHIIVGLYNSYARIPTGVRQKIFSIGGRKAFRFLDAHLRRKDVDESKKAVWFADQYQNPHESWHSVDEILGWFDTENVRFLSGVPAISKMLPGEGSIIRLFDEHPRGNALEHVLRQIRWIPRYGPEGGLFVLVGRKAV